MAKLKEWLRNWLGVPSHEQLMEYATMEYTRTRINTLSVELTEYRNGLAVDRQNTRDAFAELRARCIELSAKVEKMEQWKAANPDKPAPIKTKTWSEFKAKMESN